MLQKQTICFIMIPKEASIDSVKERWNRQKFSKTRVTSQVAGVLVVVEVFGLETLRFDVVASRRVARAPQQRWLVRLRLWRHRHAIRRWDGQQWRPSTKNNMSNILQKTVLTAFPIVYVTCIFVSRPFQREGRKFCEFLFVKTDHSQVDLPSHESAATVWFRAPQEFLHKKQWRHNVCCKNRTGERTYAHTCYCVVEYKTSDSTDEHAGCEKHCENAVKSVVACKRKTLFS